MQTPNTIKVFTTGQVAKICHVANRTVSKWFDAGRLKGYRIPMSEDRRIPRESLIEFLRKEGMPLGDLAEQDLHKILLVGTEATFNDRLQELLPVSEDFKYDHVDTTFQAGMALRDVAPDTIIVDLRLGRHECICMMQAMRKIETHAGTFAIAIAGEDETNPEYLTFYAGFSEWHKQPCDPAAIAERIRTMAEAMQQD